MKTLNGHPIIDVESFLDNSIPDLDERLATWQYELCAFMNQWQLVLEAKWMYAAIWQGRLESEGLNMDAKDEVINFLKAYADELNNRYQVQTLPYIPNLLELIENLDGKAYRPTVWSL